MPLNNTFETINKNEELKEKYEEKYKELFEKYISKKYLENLYKNLFDFLEKLKLFKKEIEKENDRLQNIHPIETYYDLESKFSNLEIFYGLKGSIIIDDYLCNIKGGLLPFLLEILEYHISKREI